MTATLPSLPGIYNLLHPARPPSIDHYLNNSEEDSSSSEEEVFKQWWKDRVISDRKKANVKKLGSKQSGRKGSTGRGSKKFSFSTNRSGKKQKNLVDPVVEKVKEATKPSVRKSFNMNEIGGRRISLFDKEEVAVSTDSVDEPRSEIKEPAVAVTDATTASTSDPDTVESFVEFPGVSEVDEEHSNPAPPEIPEVVKPRPSYLVPNDGQEDLTLSSTLSDVQQQLGYGSTSSDNEKTVVQDNAAVDHTSHASLPPFECAQPSPTHTISKLGDESSSNDVEQKIVESSETVVGVSAGSVTKSKSILSRRKSSKRRNRRICMPTVKKRPAVSSPSNDNNTEESITPSVALANMEKMRVEVSIPRLTAKKSHQKKSLLSPKSSTKTSPDQSGDVSSKLSQRMERILYSPSKKKPNVSDSPSIKKFGDGSLNVDTLPSSPMTVVSPQSISLSRDTTSSGPRLASNRKTLRKSTKKLSVHSKTTSLKRTSNNSKHVSPGDSFPSLTDSMAENGLETMKKSAFEVIASIGDNSVDVSDYDNTTSGLPDLDPDSMSSSRYTNPDTVNTEDSVEEGESSDTENASGTDTPLVPVERLPKGKRPRKRKWSYVSLPRRNKKRAASKNDSKESGTEEEESFENFPTNIGEMVKLDAYTPISKGIPFNRSQIIKSIGGHEYHMSPTKKRVGVTPGVRRSKRNRVPVGKQYVYGLDENMLPTVAGMVKLLEEQNEEKLNVPRKRPTKRVSPNACFLDHAFSNLPLDQAEAKFSLETSTGDLMDVEFMKHLSVCPKKTIDGANATKEDPLIINPVFAMESCSIGVIILNADGNKPRQVTAGALIVFLLMSGKIEVEIQNGDVQYKQDIQPICRFWIPEDVAYSIKNIGKTPAELVYIRLKV